MYSFRLFKFFSVIALIVLLSQSGSTNTAAAQNVLKVQVVADEMCCKGCAQKVAAQLYAAPGVTSVEADIPNRLVTVIAKPSPKLTLELIWQAVEKGKGGPSKLVTPDATYVLTRSENLKPEKRLAAGRYSLEVRNMEDKEVAKQIANQLYAVRGVESIRVDMAQRMLLVQSANGISLSPWALATAVERAQGELTAVSGPYGVLTVERSAASKPVASARSTYSPAQGEVR